MMQQVEGALTRHHQLLSLVNNVLSENLGVEGRSVLLLQRRVLLSKYCKLVGAESLLLLHL